MHFLTMGSFSGSHAVTDENLRGLSHEILHIYPAELIRASVCVASAVDLILSPGVEYELIMQQSCNRIQDLGQKLKAVDLGQGQHGSA